MITSNVAYAALAYLPINPRSQASLQRALVAKSAATIVATIQSNPSEQRKHKNYFLAQNLNKIINCANIYRFFSHILERMSLRNLHM